MSSTFSVALAEIDQEIATLMARVDKLRVARTSLVALLGEVEPAVASEPAAPPAPAVVEDAAPQLGATVAKHEHAPAVVVASSDSDSPVAKPARAPCTPVSQSAQEPLPDTKLGRTLAMVREGKGRDAIAKALGITIGHVDANLYKLRKLGLIAGHGAKPERATPEPEGEEGTDLEQPQSRPMPAPKVDRPPALPIDLERRTIAVDAITVREDRFRCLPLACTLSAGSCVDRQETANRTPGKGGRGEVEARARSNSFPMCRACAIGIQVAARLREGQS